jgi:hypothetical protein
MDSVLEYIAIQKHIQYLIFTEQELVKLLLSIMLCLVIRICVYNC